MHQTDIYTDGSCHTQLRIGGWAALVLLGDEQVWLEGCVHDTTHNSMELTAVIEALKYLQETKLVFDEINIFSDSQYVVGLVGRAEKLAAKDFTVKKGGDIRNAAQVKELLLLSEILPVTFHKVKAHQAKGNAVNYNIDVDKRCRQVVRGEVAKVAL